MNFSTHQLPEVLLRRISVFGWKETTSAQDQILMSIARDESFILEAHRGSGKRSAALLGIAAKLYAGSAGRPLDPNRRPRALIITETDAEAVTLCARFEALTAGTHLSALVLGEGGDIARAQRSILGVDLILGRANFIDWACDRFKLDLDGVEMVGVFCAMEVFDTAMGLPRLEKVLKRLPKSAEERLFFLSDEIQKRCEKRVKSRFPNMKILRAFGRYGAPRLLERFDLVRHNERTLTLCERAAQFPREVRVLVLTVNRRVSKIAEMLNAADVPAVAVRKRDAAGVVEKNMELMGAHCAVADLEQAAKTFPQGMFDVVVFHAIPEDAGEYESAAALAWFEPTKRRPWCGFALTLCLENQYREWNCLRTQIRPSSWRLLDCTGGQNEIIPSALETLEGYENRCVRALNHARSQVGLPPLPARGKSCSAEAQDDAAQPAEACPAAPKGTPVSVKTPWTFLEEAGALKPADEAAGSAQADESGDVDSAAEGLSDAVFDLTDIVWEAQLKGDGRVVELGAESAAGAPEAESEAPATEPQDADHLDLFKMVDGVNAPAPAPVPALASTAAEPREPAEAAAEPAPCAPDEDARAPETPRPPEAQTPAAPDETSVEAPCQAPVERAEEAGPEAGEEAGEKAEEEAAAGVGEDDAREASGASLEDDAAAHENEEAFEDDGAQYEDEYEDEDELPEDEAFDDDDAEWDDAGEDEEFEEDDFEDDGEYADDEEAYGHEHDEDAGDAGDEAPHRRTLTIRSGYVPRKEKDEPVVTITEPLSSNTVELRAAQERMRREMKGGERLTHQMVGRRGTIRRPKRRAGDAMPAEQEGILAAQPSGRRGEKDGERRRQKKNFQKGAKNKQHQKQQRSREKGLQPAFLAEDYAAEALTVPGEGSLPVSGEERRPKPAQKQNRKQRNAQKKGGSLRTPYNKRRKQRQEGEETPVQAAAPAPAAAAAAAPVEASRMPEGVPEGTAAAPQTAGEAAPGAETRPAGGKQKRRRDQQNQQGQQKGRRHRDKDRRARKTGDAEAPVERGFSDEGGADDNFGNSIHYRPKRAAAAAMPWQTAEAYAADRPQTLSFAQTMPGESGFEVPRTIFGSSQPDNKVKPSGGRKFQKFRKSGGHGGGDRSGAPRGRSKFQKKPRGE